jgi:anti-anti-sigma factor
VVTIEKENQIIIFLSDRIDSMNADETQEIILDALKVIDRDIVIDVTKLNYISSAGLQVVLKCAQLAQEQHKASFLKGAKGTIKEIFQVSGFLTFMQELA